MKLRHLAFASLLLASPALFSSTAFAANPPTMRGHTEQGIAWFKGDVDAAFALAKSSNKPLFLYWGATWCPPCNQVKATIFNRQNFIERSRFFIPVYIDGDSPSAQKLGDRFKVRGYPTMILFNANGTETTRLPGEVDAARYVQVLTLGMGANHSVQDLLQMAKTDASKLTADDWRLLSFYTWGDAEHNLLAAKDLPNTLLSLAKASSDPESATRLHIRALLSFEKGKASVTAEERAALMAKVQDQAWAKDNMDLLVNSASEFLAVLSNGLVAEESAKLRAQFNATLHVLLKDEGLSRADRLGALGGLVSIAKLDGKLSEEMQKLALQHVSAIEKATTNAYERQAVISAGAYILVESDQMGESDNLLKAELKRSHSPYYFMLSLASNAKKRNDIAGALNWYEQAYQAAKGPATRLQWGASYLNGLLDLAPQDEGRIGKVASSILQELGKIPDAFYDRNRGVLERTGRKLVAWNADGKHQASFSKVQQQMDDICKTLPKNDAERETCKAILAPAKAQM